MSTETRKRKKWDLNCRVCIDVLQGEFRGDRRPGVGFTFSLKRNNGIMDRKTCRLRFELSIISRFDQEMSG